MNYLDRKFGLEMEWERPYVEDLWVKLKRTGYRRISYGPSYSHCTGEEEFKKGSLIFTVKGDGSVSDGSEWITPPLRWKQRGQITQIVRLAQSLNCRTSRYCGLHIHVDMTDYRHCGEGVRQKHRKRTLALWGEIKSQIKRLYHPYESRLRYCDMNLDDHLLSEHRGVAVNLSRFHHETVEYRFFNATTRIPRILKFLKFSLAFTHLMTSDCRIPEYTRGDPLDWTIKQASKV